MFTHANGGGEVNVFEALADEIVRKSAVKKG